MESFIYEEVVKRTIFGYAYNKIILDEEGKPKDYKILDANSAFEEYTGLKLKDIINKNFIAEILKNKEEYDWASLYGYVALNNKKIEFDVYSNNLKKYYEIKAFSPEKYYFITIVKDKTIEKEIQKTPKYFRVIGDFTIFFEKNTKLKNKELFEICLNQVGLFIESKNIEKKLIIQAEIDPLTGAYNRNAIKKNIIDDKLKKAKEKNLLSCISVIDIDNFKEINNSYGHMVGDHILQYMTKRIMRGLRKEDILVRTGGDEFLIYLHNVKTKEGAKALIKRLMKKCSSIYRMNEEPEIEEFELKISISMGAALFPENGEELEELMINAGNALYMAKKVGGGNYFFYNSEELSSRIEIYKKRQKIYKYIKKGKIKPYYQPIMNIQGEIVRVEALARIIKNNKEIISPKYFIPLSEETKLIEEIGDEILKKVVRDMISWKKQNKELIVSINLATRQLNMDFYNKVIKELSENHIDFKNIMFEIIEEKITNTSKEAIEIVELFRKLGIKISIDDFGVGYSSLARVANLPKDEIKIDKLFLKDILDKNKSKTNRIIIKALNDLGKDVGIDIVMEGVETKEEFEIVTKLGCKLIQGFYFSKALSKEAFDKKYIE